MPIKEVTWREKSHDIYEGVPVATLTSDFGEKWPESQVELALHRENPSARLIVLAQISRYSITEGGFILLKSYKLAPRHSIHIGVVDPDVGTERKGLVIKTRDFWFVGPDNGLLYPAAENNGIEDVFEIDNNRINTTGSNTFHGRDIFGPVAGRLLGGEHPERFARPISTEEIIKRTFKPTEVVQVDPYGNVKLAGSPEAPDRRLLLDDQVIVRTDKGNLAFPFKKSFGYVGEGQPVAYRGSHETLELAVRLGRGDEFLGGVQIGQVLEITPEYRSGVAITI